MRACAFSWRVCLLPLSRHAAPPLLQYACSRVPAPHRKPHFLLPAIDLLAARAPSLSGVKYKPSECEDGPVH